MTQRLLSKEKEAALRQLVGRAVDLHRTGLLREAERLYRQVLQGMPRNVQAQHLLGVLCGQQGRLGEALELLSSAVKVDPGRAAALADFGLILHKLDRHEEALATFEKALAIEPQNAAALSIAETRWRSSVVGKRRLAPTPCVALAASRRRWQASPPHWPQSPIPPRHTMTVRTRLRRCGATKRRLQATTARSRSGQPMRTRSQTAAAHCSSCGALATYDRALAISPLDADRPRR